MSKITLSPIPGSYASVVALNARFKLIEAALNDNVLWRDGFTGEPNSMAVDFDMAGNTILNALIDSSNIFNADTLELENGAYYLARANHTGTQDPTTITGVTASAADLNKTVTALYFPDGAVGLIANVATRANKFLHFDAAGEMTYTAGSTTVSANAVSITDAGNYYSPAVEVEAALQEVGESLIGFTSYAVAAPAISLKTNLHLCALTTGTFAPTLTDIAEGQSIEVIVANAVTSIRPITYNANWSQIGDVPQWIEGEDTITLRFIATSGVDSGIIVTGVKEKEDKVLLATATASTDATIEFIDELDKSYYEYILEYYNVDITAGSGKIFLELSANSGGAWAASFLDLSASGLSLTAGLNKATGKLFLKGSSEAEDTTAIADEMTGLVFAQHAGGIQNTTQYDSLRVNISASTIASGEFRLYGVNPR